MRESDTSALELPTVDVVVRGAVATDEMIDAEYAVARATTDVRRPIHGARVRITRYGGVAPFAVTQANLAVAERLVRAQSVAATVPEAIDQVADRLRHRLHRLHRHLAAEEAGRVTFIGEERPLLPLPQPAGRPPLDPVGQGRLVRSKTFPLAVQSPDAAVLTMELRDYDFHLFTEDSTEAESIVYRGGATGYGLRRLAVAAQPVCAAVPLTVQRHPAPTLGTREAIERLNNTPSRRFLFLADPRTGRGRALYRRYDGHLALITPAW